MPFAATGNRTGYHMQGNYLPTIKTSKNIKLLQMALLVIGLLLPAAVAAAADHYDLVYIWDTDLDNVLDYKEELEAQIIALL